MSSFRAVSSPLRWIVAGLAIGVSACALASCSSDKEPDFPDPDVAGRDVNPDGIAYPTDHIGGEKRSALRRGDRIPNFTFQAYVDGDRAAGLKTISLADYYDPKQKRWKLLHLEVASTWCAICSSEAEATVIAKEPLGKEGVAYLEVIVSGAAAGEGPSLSEVDSWVSRHKSNFTTGIDVRARRLGSIGVAVDVMPWDIMIDTRTMEILDSSGGAPADIVVFDRSYLALLAKITPAYE